MRDKPYSEDEKRVSDYLQEITEGQIGSGDDPVGFLIASHRMISYQLQQYKLNKKDNKAEAAIEAAFREYERKSNG